MQLCRIAKFLCGVNSLISYAFFLLNPPKDPSVWKMCLYMYICYAWYLLVNKLLCYPILQEIALLQYWGVHKPGRMINKSYLHQALWYPGMWGLLSGVSCWARLRIIIIYPFVWKILCNWDILRYAYKSYLSQALWDSDRTLQITPVILGFTIVKKFKLSPEIPIPYQSLSPSKQTIR